MVRGSPHDAYEQTFARTQTGAQVSDDSAPDCTNGSVVSLRAGSVAQKNKPSTMFSSKVQSNDLLMEGTAWLFWTMRHSNGYSTPDSRSSVAKQRNETTRSKDEDMRKLESSQSKENRTWWAYFLKKSCKPRDFNWFFKIHLSGSHHTSVFIFRHLCLLR